MKASVDEINSVQKRLSVTIPAEEVNKAFEGVYRKIKAQVQMPGFRKGKVPLAMVKKNYGGHASQQVSEDLINDYLFKAISEQEIKPVSSPVLENMEGPDLDKEFKFTAVLDVMPSLELKDYKGLEISVPKYTVDADVVDRELRGMARHAATKTPMEDGSTAEANCQVTISHTAKLDGEDLPQFKSEGVQIALGEQEIFEELDKGIIGMARGESKEIEVNIPKDFQEKDVAGKKVTFNVTVDDLIKLDIPEIDDEFAKKYNSDDVAALRTSVSDQINSVIANKEKQAIEQSLLEAFLSKNEFEVPPAMVDQVIDDIIREMGVPKEHEEQAKKDERLRDSLKEQAKTRVRNTIGLWEVSKAENLEISDDEVKDYIKKSLGEGTNNPDEMVEKIFANSAANIKESLTLEKSLKFLQESAKITEVETKA